MKPIKLFTLFSAVLLSLCLNANAAIDCSATEATDTKFEILQNLITDKCLGGINDNDILVKNLTVELNKVGPDAGIEARHRAVNTYMGFIVKSLDQKLKNLPIPDSVESNPLKVLRDEVDITIQEFEAGLTTDRITVEHWDIDPDDGSVGNIYTLKTQLFDPACPEPDVDCRAALDLGEETVRFAVLMVNVANYWGKDDFRAFGRKLTIVDEQWKQYATKARSQFIWELYLNSKFYNLKPQEETLLREPPNHQIILLHPSIAIEYVDAADSGNKFQPAILMEWIGWNGWKWKTDGDVKMKRPLGISAVSTFSDRKGADNVGYGAVLHYNNNYSLGVTAHGGDIGIFLSVDLQKFLMDKESQLKDVRTLFRKK